MKNLLYIVSFIGLSLTFQSCDRLSGLLGGESDSPQEQVADNYGEAEPITNHNEQSTDTKEKAATAKMQSQLQRNEDGIKKLNDSLNVLNSNLQMCQSKLATLQQKQNELESDKVGVKNLFVYLAIFSVVAIFLVVLLSKKIAGKGNLTEKQVKDIITDFASRHPEIINGRTLLTLSQYLGYIQTNKKNIESINLRLNALTNLANGQVGGNAPTGQQSWEKQATLGVQQKEAERQSAGTSRVFYMKRPLKDMEFELSLKRERPTEETMYRFEIESKRPNFAHFVFDCDSPNRVRWALNTKDKTLDRVCNASGSGTNGKYQCTAEGEAELRDGKWVVTRKAVVIFD